MIEVTVQGKLGKKVYLNPHMIETIENRPDTTIILTSGRIMVVAESYETIYQRIVAYRKELGSFGNEE